MALQFKNLYQKSQEAYSEGEKALAKDLATEGHTVQDKCEALNKEANKLRGELKTILDKIKFLQKKREDLKLRISKYQQEKRKIRVAKIRGFHLSEISPIEIEIFLDEFSQKLVEKIEEIKYIDIIKYIDKLHTKRLLGHCNFVPETEKFVIRIFKHTGKTREKIKKAIKETITHEIGHVLYRYLTAEEELEWRKLWWNNISNKKKFISGYKWSPRQDFAECFVIFKFNPRKLKKDIIRYNFIKKVYFSINQRKARLYYEET